MSDPRTADWFARFAVEAHGESPVYERWARGMAVDAEALALLDPLPFPKRQPNLVFAVSRLLGAPEGPWAEYRAWFAENIESVRHEASTRSTQTNEPRRLAALLPALALLPGPLALLEVGASAGLCLLPDRYGYRWGDGGDVVGRGELVLECATTGPVPLPPAPPAIAWRAGVDLDPLDVRDDGDVHWLETLVWPEQHERRRRLRAAIEIARRDPPPLVRGDAVDALGEVAAGAPADATLVVVNSGTLVYLSRDDRARYRSAIATVGAHWLSLEGLGVFPDLTSALPATPRRAPFLLALDERPLAFAGAHGQYLDWFE